MYDPEGSVTSSSASEEESEDDGNAKQYMHETNQ